MNKIIVQSDSRRKLEERGKGLTGVLLIFMAMIAVTGVFLCYGGAVTKDIFSTTITMSLKDVGTFAVAVSGVWTGISKRSPLTAIMAAVIGILIYSGPNVSTAF